MQNIPGLYAIYIKYIGQCIRNGFYRENSLSCESQLISVCLLYLAVIRYIIVTNEAKEMAEINEFYLCRLVIDSGDARFSRKLYESLGWSKITM